MSETRDVFAQAVRAVEEASIVYAVFGGVAVWEYGDRRPTKDIDFLLCPADADRALEALGAFGFSIERTDPAWLYKARKDDVNVDVIFEVAGGDVPCEAVLSRRRRATVEGIEMNVIAPEDLILIKLAVIKPHRPWDWFDALAVLKATAANLDWEYLVERSHSNPERLLSLLLFARTSGHGEGVPNAVPARLAREARL